LRHRFGCSARDLAAGTVAATGYRQTPHALLYGGPASVGRIAQLVEQLTLNQRVQGSSPCAPTILKNNQFRAFFTDIIWTPIWTAVWKVPLTAVAPFTYRDVRQLLGAICIRSGVLRFLDNRKIGTSSAPIEASAELAQVVHRPGSIIVAGRGPSLLDVAADRFATTRSSISRTIELFCRSGDARRIDREDVDRPPQAEGRRELGAAVRRTRSSA
jgi:hypothetical protein